MVALRTPSWRRLRPSGPTQANIDLLASLAVTKGDFLRTILAVVSNGGITTGTSTGPNEQPLRNAFPFFPADAGSSLACALALLALIAPGTKDSAQLQLNPLLPGKVPHS